VEATDDKGVMTGVELDWNNFRNMSYNMSQIQRWMGQAQAYIKVCH